MVGRGFILKLSIKRRPPISILARKKGPRNLVHLIPATDNSEIIFWIAA
jgi:hypothetical protein